MNFCGMINFDKYLLHGIYKEMGFESWFGACSKQGIMQRCRIRRGHVATVKCEVTESVSVFVVILWISEKVFTC